MFLRVVLGLSVCAVGGLHSAAWADFATDSSWMYQQQDRSYNNSVSRNYEAMAENERNYSNSNSNSRRNDEDDEEEAERKSKAISDRVFGKAQSTPAPVQQRVTRISFSEHLEKIRKASGSWIGYTIDARIREIKKTPKSEMVYVRDEYKTFSDRSSIFTLIFSDHPQSTMPPGNGYIRFFADTKGIIYGWSGLWNGTNMCHRPNKYGICTS